MDVEAIARRVDEDLVAAQEQLRAAQDKVAEAQQRIDELRVLRDGFALAVERYGDTTSGQAEPRRRTASKRQPRRSRRPGGPVKSQASRESAGTEAAPAADGVPAPAADSVATPAADGEPSLADACLAVLADFGRAATTTEVVAKLAEAGRVVRPELVRSSLGYLERRAGKVKRVGRALWELQA
ncbi:MAG TPA: hypothetical protein VGH27_02285 [Streptosporangiaceae bacterium]